MSARYIWCGSAGPFWNTRVSSPVAVTTTWAFWNVKLCEISEFAGSSTSSTSTPFHNTENSVFEPPDGMKMFGVKKNESTYCAPGTRSRFGVYVSVDGTSVCPSTASSESKKKSADDVPLRAGKLFTRMKSSDAVNTRVQRALGANGQPLLAVTMHVKSWNEPSCTALMRL